ncbi:MAG: hypothetical protein ACKO2S_10180, partial [Burkholderiaceae bacterium]
KSSLDYLMEVEATACVYAWHLRHKLLLSAYAKVTHQNDTDKCMAALKKCGCTRRNQPPVK